MSDEKDSCLIGGKDHCDGENKRESLNRQSVGPEFYQDPRKDLDLDLDSQSDQQVGDFHEEVYSPPDYSDKAESISSCSDELSFEENEDMPYIDGLVIMLLKQRSTVAPLNIEGFRNISAICTKIDEKRETPDPEARVVSSYRYDLEHMEESLGFILYNGKFVKLKTAKNKDRICLLSSGPQESFIAESPKKFEVSLIGVPKLRTITSDEQPIFRQSSCFVKVSEESFAMNPLIHQTDIFIQRLPLATVEAAYKEKKGTREPGEDIRIECDPNFPDCFRMGIHSSDYGAYINLSQHRFNQRLLLEHGMLFMLNSRVGFYISEIGKEEEFKKREAVLKELVSRSSFDLYCHNIDPQQMPQLLDYLKHRDANSCQKPISVLYKEFCLKLLSTERLSDFIVLSFVEYYPEYNIFKVVRECLVFKYQVPSELSGASWFQSSQGSFDEFNFGQKLFQSIRKTTKSKLCAITSFCAPYNLVIGLNDTVRRFYLSYDRSPLQQASYCSLFDNNEAYIRQTPLIQNLNSGIILKEEGLWLCIRKFDLECDHSDPPRYVKVSFGSLIMILQNVFLVQRKHLAILNK